MIFSRDSRAGSGCIPADGLMSTAGKAKESLPDDGRAATVNREKRYLKIKNRVCQKKYDTPCFLMIKSVLKPFFFILCLII